MILRQEHLGRQAGFTLVELAVVMIIIGLLIGGILKGQELITNAQVTSAVSQMKGNDAAVTTFRDTYAAVPGDMAGALTRLPNCTAATNCGNGNGDNRIGVAAGVAPALGNEGQFVWRHLSAADLINGVDNSATMSFGQALPEAAIGGGYFLGFHTQGAALPGSVDSRSGHYLALTGNPAANVGGVNSAVLRASQAARIDRKMDDGAPNTGSILAATGGGAAAAACTANVAGVVSYNEATDPLDCALYARIQQ